MGGDKKRVGGLVISRGILSGLPLRIQQGEDPFCGYERSECKISSAERHCSTSVAMTSPPELFFVGTHIFSAAGKGVSQTKSLEVLLAPELKADHDSDGNGNRNGDDPTGVHVGPRQLHIHPIK